MSPYLSSKTPWAPCCFASFVESSCNVIGIASLIFLLTVVSICFISSSVSFLSKLKSNLSLSGVMLLPRWKMFLSLRISLRAWFRRWHAVWSFVVCSELSARPDLNFPAEAVRESCWCFWSCCWNDVSSTLIPFSFASSVVISIGKP